MNLYPAIDLFRGRVVRLERGDYNKETVYSENPAEMACQWAEQGALWLHIVDLEGAKDGVLKNLDSLAAIRQAVDCRIEFGGGLRSLGAMRSALEAGADRVILGTKAMDEAFLKKALATFADKVAVGLDVRHGKVQMEGWLKEGGKGLEEALDWLNPLGVETLIYTDIQKDGMLAGPNFKGLEKVLAQSRSKVILSGGVSSLADIRRAGEIVASNFEGVIMGKAIYEKKFTVQEALSAAAGTGGLKNG